MPEGGHDGYDVTSGELRAHASRLDALMDRLRTAADAGNQVTMGTEAYGKICAFFVPIVQNISTPGVEALGQRATDVGDAAGRVRDTATQYDSDDRGQAQTLGGMH